MIAFLKLVAGGFSFVGQLIAVVFKWLLEKPIRLVVAVLLVLLAFQTISKGWVITERDQFELKWTEEKRAHEGTEKNFREASAEATRLAIETKTKVEIQYVEIENAQDQTIRDHLATALSSLRSREASTNPSGADSTRISGIADTSLDLDGEGGGAKLDDLAICTANTIKAQGWQDWHHQVTAVDRGSE